jgi:type IV pilus assembly protein PilA
MKQKRQQGFTLIELMIVVAIVAILAAVALPFYADFTFRAKMSEVAASIDACKVSVQDYHESEAEYPSTADAAGCDTTPTQYTTGLEVSGASADGVTISVDGAGDVAGCNLELATTDGGASWAGTSDGAECGAGDKGKVPPLFR